MSGTVQSADSRVVLITGISGSGKSVALHALEDAGYYCVDNLPPELVPQLLAVAHRDHRERVAVALDVRSVAKPQAFAQLLAAHPLGTQPLVLFLDASTPMLVQRFSETRRRHPLSQAPQDAADPAQRALIEAIEMERDLLEPVRASAQCFDTSHSTPSQLRAWVRQAVQATGSGLSLVFESFGFKRGVPLDADFVFDARMLPNPFYDPAMRSLTGLDAAVCEHLQRDTQAQRLVDDIATFLGHWLPAFEAEQRSYLTVAVGCTGGQHRSVFIVEQLAMRFQAQADVIVRHRELQSSRSLSKSST